MRDRVEPIWAFPECIMMIINAFLKCQIPVWYTCEAQSTVLESPKHYNNTQPDLIMHAMAHSILHPSLHPHTHKCSHAQEQKPISVRSFKHDYDFYPCIMDMIMKTTLKITSAFLFLDRIVTNKWCILYGFDYYACMVIIRLFKWCLYGIMGYLIGCWTACKRFCR